MKTFCNLPDYIQLPDGTLLKPVIGGMLNKKPFLHTVSLTKSGNVNEDRAIEQAKRLKLKHRKVMVVEQLYIFVQVNEPARIIKEYVPRK